MNDVIRTSSALPHYHPRKLPSLTGLRFVAAALVFGFHASLTKIIGFNPYADQQASHAFKVLFSEGGWIGVSFFFVLSGFVITWSARPDDTVGSFIFRRVLKIYPNHFATWALTMILFGASVTPASIWLPNLLLVHAWIPKDEVYLGVNGPSWSLCCELFFYVLFPFLLIYIKRIPENRLWIWAVAMVAGLFACQSVINLLVPGTPWVTAWPISVERWWLSYFFPPFRLFEFVLGMLMARILMTGRWIGLGLVPAFGLLVAGYIFAMFVPFQFSFNVATVVPIAFLITSVAAADVAGRRTGFAGRTMNWLGDISFGMYMIHLVILTLVTNWLNGRLLGTPAATALVLAAFGASVLGGWLLFVCIERPVMRRWGKAVPRKSALMGAEV
ncbi:acyltransferase [Burkholderia ubonensis]|uniref:acyltransferase family protein n=1 Tax=Burkholderia ubonensis TaxID=101571 RepID=UPI000751F69B|nr:acyltransferase [Burkholderia ubonensis]KVM61836.1 acyltransferase [Burkholderia ubonensis]